MNNYEPLTESYFYILYNLNKNINYGYAIMKNTQDITEDRVKIGSATMYTAISKMIQRKWIEEQSINDGKFNKRRTYKITELGKKILENEIKRYKLILKSVEEGEANE